MSNEFSNKKEDSERNRLYIAATIERKTLSVLNHDKIVVI